MFGKAEETEVIGVNSTGIMDSVFDHQIGDPVYVRQEIYNEQSSFRDKPYVYLILERHLIEEGYNLVQPYYIVRPQENPTATLTRIHAREVCDAKERKLVLKMLTDEEKANEGADSAI